MCVANELRMLDREDLHGQMIAVASNNQENDKCKIS